MLSYKSNDNLEFLYEVIGENNNEIIIRQVLGDEKSLETLRIPSEINGMPVTEIGGNVFNRTYYDLNIFYSYKTNTNRVINYGIYLKNLYLPQTIIRIREGAFCFCKNLKNVFFSEGIKFIEYLSFKGCAIEYVKIPESMVEIEEQAFLQNKYLTKVEFPDSFCLNLHSFRATPFARELYSPTGFLINNEEKFQRYYGNTPTGKILCENKVDYELGHFILKISRPIFERMTENHNKNTFDFIRCYVSIPTKGSFPKRDQFIEKYKKDIIKLVIYDIKKSKSFQKYGIPINFLKIDHFIITRQNEIEILFSLKEI